MTQTQPAQPEAIRLANWIDSNFDPDDMAEFGFDEIAAELRRQQARIAKLEAAICTQHKENQRLRRNWCISYAGALAYMDDGEAQDSRDLPTINFLRDPVPEIEDKIRRRGAKALAGVKDSLTVAPAVLQGCWCAMCDMSANNGLRSRMSICPECRDKRCPRANHHGNACSAPQPPKEQT